MFVKAVFVLLLVVCSVADGRKKEKEVFMVMKDDLPYIACDVCMKSVASVYETVVAARQKAFKNNLEEADVVDYVDALCRPDNVTGHWIRKQDIVETAVSGGRLLKLVESDDALSKCKEECTTIAKSCDLLFEEEIGDRDDFSLALWKNKLSLAELQDKTCKVWTKRCKNNKNKYLPAKFKREDKEFEAVSEKDLKMEELMAQMNGAGLGSGMSMYDRNDMENMMGDPYGDEDGYGDMGLGDMGGYGNEF